MFAAGEALAATPAPDRVRRALSAAASQASSPERGARGEEVVFMTPEDTRS